MTSHWWEWWHNAASNIVFMLHIKHLTEGHTGSEI